MPLSKSENTQTQTLVEMPKALKELVKRCAKAEGLTVNEYIRQTLVEKTGYTEQ